MRFRSAVPTRREGYCTAVPRVRLANAVVSDHKPIGRCQRRGALSSCERAQYSGRAAVIFPSIFAIDEVVSNFDKALIKSPPVAVRASGIVRAEHVLEHNAIRVILLVCCNHRIGGLRPKADDTSFR